MPQQQLYLDLINIQNTPYSASELRLIIEQRVPCGPFFVTARDEGNHAQLSGLGAYIKRATDTCYIEVVEEQGSCHGLMSRLFPGRRVREGTCTATSPAR